MAYLVAITFVKFVIFVTLVTLVTFITLVTLVTLDTLVTLKNQHSAQIVWYFSRNIWVRMDRQEFR